MAFQNNDQKTIERLQRVGVSGARQTHRVDDLNREMMRLPLAERRKRWKEYYFRLNELMEPRDS
jgi:hypothetical protein